MKLGRLIINNGRLGYHKFWQCENFALVNGPWKIIGSAATSQILGHLCPQVIAGGNWGVDITLQK